MVAKRAREALQHAQHAAKVSHTQWVCGRKLQLIRAERVDTPTREPRLRVFRGELREELRDRRSRLRDNRGDPLNLIRVMPAKGRKLLAKIRPSRIPSKPRE